MQCVSPFSSGVSGTQLQLTKTISLLMQEGDVNFADSHGKGMHGLIEE